MFSSRKIGLALAAILLAAGMAGAAEPGSFGYGRVATPAQIAGWDIDVRGEDGAGLPAGKPAPSSPRASMSHPAICSGVARVP